MSRSDSRHRRAALEGRRRWLTTSAGAIAASVVITGGGLIGAPSATATAPVVPVQDVALTATPDWATDLQGLLASLGLGDTQIGDLLAPFGLGSADTVHSLLADLIGSFAGPGLASVLPTWSVHDMLGWVGLQGSETLGQLLWLAGGVTITDLEQLFGFTLDPDTLNGMAQLGLQPSSTIGDVLGSTMVGSAVGLGAGDTLADQTLNDLSHLFGIDPTVPLFQELFAHTMAQGVENLFGVDGSTQLITLVADSFGLAGVTAATSLNDLIGDIGVLLG